MKRNEINKLLPTKIAATYNNLDVNKSKIIKENNKKSGVYLWTNLITGKIYVGSSVNLGRRFKGYLTISHISMANKSNSLIHKSLLKYGYSNFQLEIIEYCPVEICRDREQHFINLLNPEYNILKIAGSSLGFKHSEVTLEKMHKFLITHNAKKRLPVELTDTTTNITTRYISITAAAAAVNTNEKNVRFADKHNKLLIKRHTVRIIRESK